MERLVITSREFYAYYFKEIGVSGGCSNRRILEEKTGVPYNRLRNIFGDHNRYYYENEDIIIIRVKVWDYNKGRQSVSRRGKGGMEKFARFIRKDGDY